MPVLRADSAGRPAFANRDRAPLRAPRLPLVRGVLPRAHQRVARAGRGPPGGCRPAPGLVPGPASAAGAAPRRQWTVGRLNYVRNCTVTLFGSPTLTPAPPQPLIDQLVRRSIRATTFPLIARGEMPELPGGPMWPATARPRPPCRGRPLPRPTAATGPRPAAG